jgi:hypothetical protein
VNTGAMQAAFVEASRALGFKFEPNFVFGQYTAVGLIRGFGAVHGTLIFGLDDRPPSAILEQLRSEGYFYSLLSESYEHFDEESFRGTLDDWGYFGPEGSRPSWYTGKPWR